MDKNMGVRLFANQLSLDATKSLSEIFFKKL